jgi:hypothetical protein
MKHLYGDYPHIWGRIKSIDQTPAEYANAIERTGGTETRGDIAVKWAVRFGLVFVLCLLAVEKFA